MKNYKFEVCLPEITETSDPEELASDMTNAIYSVAVRILERGEMNKVLSGNGHHAAQKVAQFASDEVLRRRMDGKKPPGYKVYDNTSYKNLPNRCVKCKHTRISMSSRMNLPTWDWCHKHDCKINQHQATCDDFEARDK